MSYTRACKTCGQRISLRQMQSGQWVAFDVSTEEPHECGTQHDPDITIKLKGKSKKKSKDAEESIDLGYDDDTNTYDSVSGMHHCMNKAIEEEKRIFIEYYSYWKKKHSSRELSPIKKFKYKDRNYLQAFCHEEKAVRIFSTKSIEEVTLLDKKLFIPKKIPKPDIGKFLKKIETPEEENEEIALPSSKAKKKEKKNNPIDVNTDEKDKNVIPTSGPGFWVYFVFVIIFMGLVRGFIFPLLGIN